VISCASGERGPAAGVLSGQPPTIPPGSGDAGKPARRLGAWRRPPRARGRKRGGLRGQAQHFVPGGGGKGGLDVKVPALDWVDVALRSGSARSVPPDPEPVTRGCFLSRGADTVQAAPGVPAPGEDVRAHHVPTSGRSHRQKIGGTGAIASAFRQSRFRGQPQPPAMAFPTRPSTVRQAQPHRDYVAARIDFLCSDRRGSSRSSVGSRRLVGRFHFGAGHSTSVDPRSIRATLRQAPPAGGGGPRPDSRTG
jgi:hypothetical protein